jgi:Thiolase, N-terminal domain
LKTNFFLIVIVMQQAKQLQRRIAAMSSQLNAENSGNVCASSTSASSSSSSSSSLSADEPVICMAIRTPIGRGRRGTLKDTAPDKLLLPLFERVVEQCPKLDLNAIGDVIIGQVLTGGLGATQVRVATLLAGLPVQVPCSTVNRQCSSGLQAIVNATANIRVCGFSDHVIVKSSKNEKKKKKKKKKKKTNIPPDRTFTLTEHWLCDSEYRLETMKLQLLAVSSRCQRIGERRLTPLS